MVVVRNGQPVKVGGHTGKAMAVEEADDEREPGRFTATEKKARCYPRRTTHIPVLRDSEPCFRTLVCEMHTSKMGSTHLHTAMSCLSQSCSFCAEQSCGCSHVQRSETAALLHAELALPFPVPVDPSDP
jgi:hypothetical protein